MIKVLAFSVGFMLMLIGIILSTQQFINFPVFNTLFFPDPNSRSQVGLFGLLFFGTGFSLMLTQVFAERYGAKIAGIAFAGTLAALYIFMLISRSTVFDFDVSLYYPRDLELGINCGRENFSASNSHVQKPVLTISANPEKVSQIKSAVLKYQEKYITSLNQPPILLDEADRINRFRQVGEPKRDLMLVPVMDEGNFVRFMVPHVVLAEQDRLTFYVADDAGTTATGISAGSEKLSVTRVMVLQIDKSDPYDESNHPVISAVINLEGVADACGNY
ncbi:hypothetical protein [Salipiger bermudensis]|uniref:hypothetical protein n=1 Tax=Salipiger bermudensis TaxID=344736 RepID=UPI001A8E486E|nr:hypothetical protein [Salipiger bermudensis]MBN9675070.1 hypothetical protein [Salipiger bermudensis]